MDAAGAEDAESQEDRYSRGHGREKSRRDAEGEEDQAPAPAPAPLEPFAPAPAPAVPFPEEYTDAWDDTHVRLPCSPQHLLHGVPPLSY